MTTLDRIKILSKNRGISIRDLEAELNLPSNTIYQWKNRTPSTSKLTLVADYFNVSIDYLLGRTDFKNKDEAEFESFIKDPELQVMMRELAESDEEKRKQLRQMWDIIKKS